MLYKEFIDNASYTDIVKKLSQLANENTESSIDSIAKFLTYRSNDIYGKHLIPRIACQALIQKGPKGIEKLKEVIGNVDDFIYPSVIINSIWCASIGDLTQLKKFNIGNDPVLDKPITTDTMCSAKEIFHDIIISSFEKTELFSLLINAIYQQSFFEDDLSELICTISGTIADSSISITKQKLNEFKALIELEKREEEYQMFLKNNPVFLDPLSAKVIDKHKLGDDLITDFVIQTLEDKYIIVEIEKPKDQIFTRHNDFSAAFTHAYGQVMDFLLWIDENISYAEKKLPQIINPKGLLIIGRSTVLTENQRKKLSFFNAHNQRITVCTYDEILSKSQRLYNNILHLNDFENS